MGAVCNATATVLQQWSAMHCKVDLLLGHAWHLYYAEDFIKTMTGLLSGCLCLSGLACGTRRVHRNVEMGEYIRKREFRNWMPEILWAICCCYQACIHLLASGISVQLFNTRGWKGVWRIGVQTSIAGITPVCLISRPSCFEHKNARVMGWRYLL